MFQNPDAFPLCDSHPTLIVITGKTWCYICMSVQGELDLLQQNQGHDYHFLQLDDNDPAALAMIPKFGKIQGVPTFLLFDPASSAFIQYDGNKKADKIMECIRARQCTGRPHNVEIAIQLVDHSSFAEPSSQQAHGPPKAQPIDVCDRHPSFIVFTSKQCGACHKAAPKLEELQKEYGPHMQHFDADDHQERFEALRLQYVPTALHFDPEQKTLRKIPMNMIDQPAQYQQQPLWNAPANIIRMQSQCPASTSNSTLAAEYPMMMSGECPIMMGGECPAMTVTSLEQHMPSLQIFDASVTNPRAMTLSSAEALAATLTQRLQNAMCDNMVVDVCRACPTFFVFTGTNWCTECQMFVPELIKLKQNAKCGRYHVNHYDAQIGVDDFNRRVCRVFEIEKFPTVLIFDPKTFTFGSYHALLRFKDLKHAPDALQKVQAHSLRPPPREISFRVMAPDRNLEVPVVRMRLCAECPSVLIFAVHLDKYEHAIKQNGKGLHVLSFSPSDLEARQVFEAFKINTVPKVLIYNPHMGNFYVFDGAAKDVPANAAAALKQVKGHVWHDTPTIVVYRG